MIKFFRNIRKKLLSENKFSKYLIYALGEIFLVVIGILIALQVSNWNRSHQQNSTERLYLTNLLSDLRDQRISIETQLDQEETYYVTAGSILKDYQDDNSLNIDAEFYWKATQLGARRTFVITDPTYTDLISTGNIGILKDATFKAELIKYYQELERIEKIIQNNNTLLVDQVYVKALQQVSYEYYPDFPTVFGENRSISENMTLPVYEENLEAISKELLSNDELLLKYMNAVNLRNIVAIGHYVFLKDALVTTDALINSLEDILND